MWLGMCPNGVLEKRNKNHKYKRKMLNKPPHSDVPTSKFVFELEIF